MQSGAILTLLAALLLTPGGCGEEAQASPVSEGGSSGAAVAPPAPPGLQLPGGAHVFDLSAGSKLALPGSDGAVTLELGAIELGRARVTLTRADGSLWVKLRPMKPAESLAFDFEGVDYTLTLDELRHDGDVPAARFTVAPAGDA